MKTAELTGAALDWAVAKCKGELEYWPEIEYSTDWAQGGPIIESMCASVFADRKDAAFEGHPDDFWFCEISEGGVWHGATPLIAAMRAYVASKLGDDIDVPEELS